MLKEVGKTYHVCPTYNGGRDWPQGAYNPRSNVMFMPLTNLCIDSTARIDRGPDAAVRLQHEQRRQVRDRQGQGRPHRCDLGRDRQDVVELGERASRTTRRSSRPAAGFCSTAPWTATCERSMRISGTVLWQTRLAAQAVGGTVTYSVNGRQYIAIDSRRRPARGDRRGHDSGGGHLQRWQRRVRLRAAAIGRFGLCAGVRAGGARYPRSAGVASGRRGRQVLSQRHGGPSGGRADMPLASRTFSVRSL